MSTAVLSLGSVQIGYLGEELDQYLDPNLVPRPTRTDIRFSDISTREEADQYIRRFFHGAVTQGLGNAKGSPLRVVWADIARRYWEIREDLRQNVGLDDVLEMVEEQDIRSAQALQAQTGSAPVPKVPGVTDGEGSIELPTPSNRPMPSIKRSSIGVIALAGAIGIGLLASAKYSKRVF